MRPDTLDELLLACYPEGFDEEWGDVLYSVLCGADVVLDDGTRLHRSWRGTGDAIAGADGLPHTDYGTYYLGGLPDGDPRLALARAQLLAHAHVACIEGFPREAIDDEGRMWWPQEEENPAHPTGWNQIISYHAADPTRRIVWVNPADD